MWDSSSAQVSFAEIEGAYFPGQPPVKGKGKWGVRVASRHNFPSPGDEVMVRKANGSSTVVTIGQQVGRDPHAFPAEARYYAIQRSDNSGPRRRAFQPTTRGQVACTPAERRYQTKLARERQQTKDAALNALRDEYRQVRSEIRQIEAGWDKYEGYDGEMDGILTDLRNRLVEIVASAEQVKAVAA